MTALPRSWRLALVAISLLALTLGAPLRAQSPPPSPEPDVVCRALADRLGALRPPLNGIAVVLGAICDELTLQASIGPTLEQAIGQKLMVRMGGTKPSKRLLGRVRRGEVGGVVLLASNIQGKAQLKRLTRRLQRAAREGGQPALLIALDQEGGDVRRVPWAPPTITVPAMGVRGSTSVARRQGRLTGRALSAVGVNMDLAPVADIPRDRTSFMRRQGRTFSSDATVTTRLADAFARGLAEGGVLATMKHFPGIGLVGRNTDRSAGVVTASEETLGTDLRPYRRAIRHNLPIVMLSNATYTAWDPDAAAGWSRAIAVDLLRGELGFEGVSITDSLDGTANARGVSAGELAELAVGAGTDMVLLTGSERTTARVYERLLAAAQAGDYDRAELAASWERIMRLKERLGTGAP